MAFVLLENRVLVTLDAGATNVGRMIQHNLRSYRKLMIPGTNPEPPAQPTPRVYHTHIVFVKEMADEVEVDGVTYLAMHKDAIVGVLPD